MSGIGAPLRHLSTSRSLLLVLLTAGLLLSQVLTWAASRDAAEDGTTRRSSAPSSPLPGVDNLRRIDDADRDECQGDCSPATCGDGVCDAGESCAGCPADCGTCQPSTGLCEVAEDCPAHNVCMQGACYGPGGDARIRGIQTSMNENHRFAGTTSFKASPSQSWVPFSDFEKIAGWGVNFVELHIRNWDHDAFSDGAGLWDIDTGPNEAYFRDHLDIHVDWCKQAGLNCAINMASLTTPNADWCTQPDWVYEASGAGNCGVRNPRVMCDTMRAFYDVDNAALEPSRQAFVDTWTYIADRYKDEDHISFMLFNEPQHHCFQSGRGGTYQKAQASLFGFKALMERAIDGIRSVHATALVWVDWPRDGFDGHFGLAQHGFDIYHDVLEIQRPNVCMIGHLYVGYGQSIAHQSSWSRLADETENTFVEDFGQCVMIGEFAHEDITRNIHSPGTWQEEIETFTEILDARKFAGRQFHYHGVTHGEYFQALGFGGYDAAKTRWLVDNIIAPGTCGDDVKADAEVCDTNRLNGRTCSDFGFAGGTLACAGDCRRYDTSGCR